MQSLRAAVSHLWAKAAGDPSLAPMQRLVPFPWRTELMIVCGGMLASFLVAGFWYPYWRIADMDFWIVYNGFLLNAGLPQEYFDHPGYLSILLLADWLRALHAVGLLRVDALTQLPPVADAAAFNAAWTAATRAARVLSLVIAMGFVVSFGTLLRMWLRHRRIASLGLFFIAFSGGMAMQMRIIRTELIASGLFFCALLMHLIAAASLLPEDKLRDAASTLTRQCDSLLAETQDVLGAWLNAPIEDPDRVTRRPDPAHRQVELSERERDVLRLTAAGKTSSEAATDLGITVRTVTYHVANLLLKLRVANKTQAVVAAMNLGLLD